MSAQRLSEKTVATIARHTGLKVVAGWAHGGNAFSFVTREHTHGTYYQRTRAWVLDTGENVAHYSDCAELFTERKRMEEIKKFVSDEKLAEWIGYHPADTDLKRTGHELVRTLYWALAREMNLVLPEGPEKTIALRAIKDAAMHANACLAIGGGPPGEVPESLATELYVFAEHLMAIADHEEDNPVVPSG